MYIFFVLMLWLPPKSTRTDPLIPTTTLFRSAASAWLGLPTLIAFAGVRPCERAASTAAWLDDHVVAGTARGVAGFGGLLTATVAWLDRKSTRLNSSH